MRHVAVASKRLALPFFIALWIAGCMSGKSQAGQTPELGTNRPAIVSPPASSPAAAVTTPRGSRADLSDFGLPSEVDPTARYLFYLHGKIIEDQGLPAVSQEYGEYQYVEILNVLQSYGFVVVSEQRPKDTDGTAYAARVSGQIEGLLRSQVPPGSITVVGASKGAAIAVIVSDMLENSEVNYVLLGTCDASTVTEWREQGISLHGNVLAIYDSADREYAGSCEEIFTSSETRGLRRHEEIILHTGTGHGVLYQPLEEWILPTVRWAREQH